MKKFKNHFTSFYRTIRLLYIITKFLFLGRVNSSQKQKPCLHINLFKNQKMMIYKKRLDCHLHKNIDSF